MSIGSDGLHPISMHSRFRPYKLLNRYEDSREMPSRFRNLSTMGNIWLDARFIRSERPQMVTRVTRENRVTGLEIHAPPVDIRLMNRQSESHTTESCIHGTSQHMIPFPCSIDPNLSRSNVLTLGRLHPESASSPGSSPL